MIQRIIPAVIGITLLLSGCAIQQDKQNVADFSAGATLLKVAHLPSSTADGSSLFITVDGKEAGLLPVGEAILLQVPAGEHRVGGYARTLIGAVTIPALKVTTSADSPRFVAYRVARYDPLFMERGIDPLPHSAPIPEKQVGQSQPVPVPQITQLSLSDNQEGTHSATQGEATEKPASTAIGVASSAAEDAVSPASVTPKPAEPTTMPGTDVLWSPTVTPEQAETPVIQQETSAASTS